MKMTYFLSMPSSPTSGNLDEATNTIWSGNLREATGGAEEPSIPVGQTFLSVIQSQLSRTAVFDCHPYILPPLICQTRMSDLPHPGSATWK